MKSIGWLAAVAAFVVTLPALAAAPALDVNSAKAFVQKLYAHYPQPANGPFLDPVGKGASAVFDPGMVAAFAEDSRLAKGEVGFIDGDPICSCQDDAGMKSKITDAKMTGKDTADVTVSIQFEGGQAEVQTLKLVVVNGQWRIHDISSKDEPSFRDALIKANARHAKGDWSHD